MLAMGVCSGDVLCRRCKTQNTPPFGRVSWVSCHSVACRFRSRGQFVTRCLARLGSSRSLCFCLLLLWATVVLDTNLCESFPQVMHRETVPETDVKLPLLPPPHVRAHTHAHVRARTHTHTHTPATLSQCT